MFPLPLGAWDGLRYFIVALLEPSIYLFYSLFSMYSAMQGTCKGCRNRNVSAHRFGIIITRPCDLDPFIPHFYVVN